MGDEVESEPELGSADAAANARVPARRLGPWLAMMLVAGNMIGSGVYLLPATLAAFGSMTIIGWVLAAIGALVLALVFAELAIRRPGGTPMSLHARDAFGPFAGFQATFLYWMSTWVGNIAIALAVAGYLSFFIPALASPWGVAFAAVGVLWLLTLVNLVGVRMVARLQGVALIIGLAPVLLVGVAGWFWFDPDTFAQSWNVSGRSPFSAIPASVILIFWAFAGLESASAAAAVVENPRRDIPIATVGGVALAAVDEDFPRVAARAHTDDLRDHRLRFDLGLISKIGRASCRERV